MGTGDIHGESGRIVAKGKRSEEREVEKRSQRKGETQLTTIGAVVSEITCVIKIDTNDSQTKRVLFRTYETSRKY